MMLSPSAHIDTFTRESLPPQESWPRLEFTLPELQYPDRLNAASVLIDEGVTRFGADTVALRTPEGEVWTYGELQQRADQVARVLVEDHGIVPGNRVMLRIPNNPWAVACWLGVLKAGAVVVTTVTAWRRQELTKVALKTRPQVVIVDHRFEEELIGSVDDDVAVLRLGGEDDEFLTACATKDGPFAAVATAADDVALLGATSGTTGEPKVTMHFHRDVLANADTFARHILQLGPGDLCVSSAPLGFTFGLGGLVVFPLRFGAASLLSEHLSPREAADLIERFGVTVLYTAPTAYRAMLKEGRADALRGLRVGVSAGEHLPRAIWEEVESATGIRLVNGIGSTEMLHVFISAAGDDIRPGATGVAVPGYRAIVLAEDGTEAPRNEIGRLAVIGPTGCRYMSDDRQHDYVVGGWNVTGDAYLRDDDGYFFFQARSDSMIVAAGYNIGAPEVEGVIDQHPDVVESAVIGRPDPDKGMIVSAFVVLRDGVVQDESASASITTFVRDRLAVYKCPRRIDFLDALPRNPNGKIQHFLLRQRAEAELAAGGSHEHEGRTR